MVDYNRLNKSIGVNSYHLRSSFGRFRLVIRTAFILCFAFAMLACKKKQDAVSTSAPENVVSVTTEPEPIVNANDTVLYYERGACFGMCPIFSFVMYADGRATYNGKNHVNRIGFYQTKVNEAALQKVVDTAKKIGYFSFQDEYDNPHVTDLPTIRTGVYADGNFKKVANRYKGPQSIKFLYEELDALIEAQNWEQTKKDN